MSRVLVAYATKKGSTREVAEAIAARLRERGLDAELEPAADVDLLARYDAVVLGDPSTWATCTRTRSGSSRATAGRSPDDPSPSSRWGR